MVGHIGGILLSIKGVVVCVCSMWILELLPLWPRWRCASEMTRPVFVGGQSEIRNTENISAICQRCDMIRSTTIWGRYLFNSI